LKIEFINFNNDPKLDPEVKPIPLSKDSKNMPPSYCLPWVEACRYSIQLKSNADYVIRRSKKNIEAWAEQDGKRLPLHHLWMETPPGVGFVPKDEMEMKENKIHLSQSPSFSSPWQKKHHHSVTIKLGISWWTPAEWGLFFCSAIHRNEAFRVVEGMVRTDRWHRDIPIVIEPLVAEVRIPKYSVVASAIVVPAQDIELISVSGEKSKILELVDQISRKRLKPGIYKKLILS
jgi:hypothetical protein